MKIIIALALVFTTFTSFADQLQGKVIKVTDGDTVNVLTSDNETHKIRLSGIDAPEKKQAFGNKSKQALDDDIGGKTVIVEYYKLDKYQRIIGKITMNGKDINLHQIQRGLAWHYKKYEKEQEVKDRSIYANAEYVAQRDKLGLWAESNPMPPWEWRHDEKEGKTEGASASNDNVVKKSRSGICHAPDSTYYARTKNFTPFQTLDECLKSGGRLPKR